ncbi:MAG: transglycosylase SLT domain-containing protein [Limnobacter sp.]|nr:transglycosylase SLT domain-containing protein [Limnobacter sp.]
MAEKLAYSSKQLSNPTRHEGINLLVSEWPELVPLDLTTEPQTVWDALRVGFSIPDVSTRETRQLEQAMARHPRLVVDTLKQAEPFIYYIVQECQRRGLPTELALLPFVESKFNPFADSGASASGLWQFIPSTGRHFELNQNRWVDERRDLIESTRAALDYLTYLYDMHGDWHLALMSYNWGEGSIKKAVEKAELQGKEPTLAHLDLPYETRVYLPKLQAFKNLLLNPKRFKLQLPNIANEPFFVGIRPTQDVDLREIARLAKIDLGHLRVLNSGLKKPVYYAAQQRPLLIPMRYQERIKTALTVYQPSKPYKTYKVRAGDTLSQIAQKLMCRCATCNRPTA